MEEFESIVSDILKDKEFNKLAAIEHHQGSRLDHSLKVAKEAYHLAKKYNLDYRAVARAGLLHDFFLEDYSDIHTVKGRVDAICNHGSFAKKNAKKFNINEKEANIIASHMFPLGKELPKSKEAWLVSLVDKTSATNEWIKNFKYNHVTQIVAVLLFFRLAI